MSSAPPRRVLVVEDELAVRELLRLHFELAGFTLEETGDGRRALDAARAKDGPNIHTHTHPDGDGARELMARVSALLRRHDRATTRTQPAVLNVRPAQLSLDRDPQDPEMLLTAWGVGYKFTDPALPGA